MERGTVYFWPPARLMVFDSIFVSRGRKHTQLLNLTCTRGTPNSKSLRNWDSSKALPQTFRASSAHLNNRFDVQSIARKSSNPEILSLLQSSRLPLNFVKRKIFNVEECVQKLILHFQQTSSERKGNLRPCFNLHLLFSFLVFSHVATTTLRNEIHSIRHLWSF